MAVSQGDWMLVGDLSSKLPPVTYRAQRRPWDICAGAIIAQEAGGFVAGSHTAPLDNNVTEDVLVGRKYIVIRAIGDTAVRPSEPCL